ncbi:MAG TPA: ribonuclease H [Dehalococcoidia bacterium]|nr:ribonuclease H [Dehalococcoidia bacterium]
MEARTFRCEQCGTPFTIPQSVREKYPGWRPKRCRDCKGEPASRRRDDAPARERRQDAGVARRADAAARAEVFTSGSCEPNPGDGGWAAVKVAQGRIVREASGFEAATTNNRMELTALVQGLEMTAPDEDATIWTPSEFCFKTATVWAAAWSRNGWRRSDGKSIANADLVRQIHALLRQRPRVRVEWSEQGAPGPWNERAAAAARTRRSVHTENSVRREARAVRA